MMKCVQMCGASHFRAVVPRTVAAGGDPTPAARRADRPAGRAFQTSM